MKKQQFNPEEFAKLKHRIEALQSSIKLDSDSEQETAKRLLIKVEKKLKDYEGTHEIPKQETEDYNTTTSFDFWNSFYDEPVHNSNTVQTYRNQNAWNPNPNFKWHVHFEDDKNYHEDTRSESEMINDLGVVLYAILGSTYQAVLNYHVYKVRFKKQTDKSVSFYRVYSDVYEDNIRICKDVIIDFLPFNFVDDRCGDMQFISMDSSLIEKYNNGCSILYGRLLDGLKDIWNFYFDVQNATPMLTEPVLAYLESSYQNSDNKKVQLNKKQRKEIIDNTENEIDSGKMKHLESRASKLIIMAYKPYQTLSSFLEESGVVYKVETSGIYIWDWDYWPNNFGKLVGYEYIRSSCYYLYLL